MIYIADQVPLIKRQLLRHMIGFRFDFSFRFLTFFVLFFRFGRQFIIMIRGSILVWEKKKGKLLWLTPNPKFY